MVNLFKIIRDNSEELVRAVEYTPFSRSEYESIFTLEPPGDEIEKARRFLIRQWQAFGSRTTIYKAGWKYDKCSRNAAYSMRNWYRLPGWILDTVDRLKTVQIENRPALEVIGKFNDEKVFIYADPPYFPTTRDRDTYKYEMSATEHEQLLEVLLKHKGGVILSGYDNQLYNDVLQGWDKHQINTTAERGLQRVETIWIKKTK